MFMDSSGCIIGYCQSVAECPFLFVLLLNVQGLRMAVWDPAVCSFPMTLNSFVQFHANAV